jgi:hypothetical protein
MELAADAIPGTFLDDYEAEDTFVMAIAESGTGNSQIAFMVRLISD